MRKLRTIEMKRLSLDEFKEAAKLPLIVVLDDVRSLYNVGSVFRCGDAFRIEAVYLCGITACPPNAEIHKTALGGEDSVTWKYFEKTEDAVQQLQYDGYFVYSIEQVEGATKLQNLYESINLSLKNNVQNDNSAVRQACKSISLSMNNPTDNANSAAKNACKSPSNTPNAQPRYAVIFGNEVKGVKQTVVDMCDGCLEIPQFGTKHSLNVSTTAGIVMWEFCKALALK
jgi:RNA methylase, spoU family